MFSAENTLITGGTFIEQHVENKSDKRRGMDLLLGASAPGAFYNSGERFDPPKCHPNTRVAVLAKIMDWVIGNIGWDGLIMWLYGPAGAGKSAIAQTIAEQCSAQDRLLAGFFFSRTDPHRSNQKRLIASLAYQIALNLPPSRPLIEAVIDRNPAIFQQSLKTQFMSLIVQPFLQLSKDQRFLEGFYPYLVIIDGFDECEDSKVQRYILNTISDSLKDCRLPVIFLITSRPEQQISAAFSLSSLDVITRRISLDDSYLPSEDIERYLNDSFHDIKTAHPLRDFVPRS